METPGNTLEEQLDQLRTRVRLLEEALQQLPYVNYEPDPSREQGVRIDPPALRELTALTEQA